MLRQRRTVRDDAAQRLEAQGLSFHARDGYWREDVCYRFSLDEVETIESATEELNALCLVALRHVVEQGRLAEFAIPPAFWAPIQSALAAQEFSLYGRFDLAYDGTAPPKLLEYNADTPTSLLETAVCQWFWLKDSEPTHDQFNSLHERLIERWRALPGDGPVYLACVADSEEDWATTTYLQDTLAQAGREARPIYIEDLGWDPRRDSFVDLKGEPIGALFKLYPWEWLMREDFAAHLLRCRTRFIEPMWKAVLSCKALLPILWELNPGHPNLLPAYFDSHGLGAHVRKPLYSREGANIDLYDTTGLLAQSSGPYGAEGHVFQALCESRAFDGHYPVIGSWIVGAQPAGMCIREDQARITTDSSHFVPHYFVA